MVLVLRQGTGLALSTPTLPPGCSQKRSPALKNTSPFHVDCYEISELGIRAVGMSYDEYFGRCRDNRYATDLDTARAVFLLTFREVKPRVAHRTGVASPVANIQEAGHVHAC